MADQSNIPDPSPSGVPPESAGVLAAGPPQRSLGEKIFLGPNGLRAGWRLLVFVAILFVLSTAIGAAGRFLGHLRASDLSRGTLSPTATLFFEAGTFLAVCLATWIMGRLERRTFKHYGLPWRKALSYNFWEGVLWGFLSISGVLLVIFLFRGFKVTGVELHGARALAAAGIWAAAFLAVGLAEEFTLRGYPQFTLTTGIGFWPSAILLSGVFGGLHIKNPGETWIGALSAALFGFVFCLTLRRTGNLWWAVGFHCAWDWGQSYFYGVPDSGLKAMYHLLDSSFAGPKWLTGGSVGPEASALTPLALAVVWILFSLKYRQVNYPDPEAIGPPSKRARQVDTEESTTTIQAPVPDSTT